MSRTRYLSAVVVIAVLTTVWPGSDRLAAAADPDPFPLKFLTEGPYALQLDGDDLQAQVVVDVKSSPVKELDKVELFVIYARHGDLDEHELAQLVSVRLVDAKSTGTPHILTLTIAAKDLVNRHGDYTIALRARLLCTGKDGKTEPTPWQDGEVVLRRAKATLTVPSGLTLTEKCFLWLTFSRSSDHFLIETDRGPAPTLLPVGGASIDGVGVDGRISLTTDPSARGPHLWAHVASIDESYPLGDATGTIRVDSPDADAANLAFTVKTRQHWLMIAIIAGSGILFGFVVRVVLALRVQRARVLLQLGAVEQEIRRLMGRIHYSVFRTVAEEQMRQITRLAGDLRKALKPETVAELEKEIPKIQTEIDKAVSNTETKRTEIQTALRTAGDAVSPAWKLPPLLFKRVATAREALKSVSDKLVANELDQAETALKDAFTDPANQIADDWRAWRTTVEKQLQLLEQEKPPLPKTTKDEYTKQLPEVLKALNRVKVDTDKSARERLVAVASGCDTGRQLTLGLLAQTVLSADRQADAVAQELAEAVAKLPAPDVIEVIQEARTELAVIEAGEVLDSPKERMPDLRKAIEAVNRSLQRASEQQFKASNTAVDAKVTKALEEGRYLDAAVATLDQVTQAATTLLSQARAPQTSKEVVEQWAVSLAERSPSYVPFAGGRTPDAPSVVVDPVKTRGELLKASVMQTALVALLFLVVAVGLYHKNFVGHVAECIQIFFWGFTVDLGVNSMLEAIRKVPSTE